MPIFPAIIGNFFILNVKISNYIYIINGQLIFLQKYMFNIY